MLQLLHDQPYASWRDVGKHFPTRTVAAVKARGALLAKKLPRKSSDGTEHVLEESILDKDSVSFMKVSNVWTKEDVRFFFINNFPLRNSRLESINGFCSERKIVGRN